jgi:hypothetical protein
VGFDAININMVNTVLNIIDPPGENSFMQLYPCPVIDGWTLSVEVVIVAIGGQPRAEVFVAEVLKCTYGAAPIKVAWNTVSAFLLVVSLESARIQVGLHF